MTDLAPSDCVLLKPGRLIRFDKYVRFLYIIVTVWKYLGFAGLKNELSR